FELRAKGRGPAWVATWDRALFWGSLIPAVLWGVAFTDLVVGLPIAPGPRYVGGLGGLVHPIALLGGLASLSLFCLHGAVFLSAKTTGELAERARRVVRWLAGPVIVIVGCLVGWASASATAAHPPAGLPAGVPLALAALVLVAVATAWAASARGHDGRAFAATAVAILSLLAAAFCALFPRVMVSTVAGGTLTIGNAASAHQTLVVMTVVAAVFTPLVLAYQGWNYWVFRQRLVRPPPPPIPGPEDPGPATGTATGTAAVVGHRS